MSTNRLSMSHCPACARVNADRALSCAACGTPLVTRCPACDTINVRSRQRCHHCAAVLDPNQSPQSVAAEAPGSPIAEVVPLLAATDDAVPADWVLGLRTDPTEPPAPLASPPLPALELPADWLRDPDGPDLTVIQLPPLLPGEATASGMSASGASASQRAAPTMEPPAVASAEAAELAARKAQRRRAVRQARMRSQTAPATEAMVRDVLVLEAEPRARADLCQTLLKFGFVPHVAVSTSEAAGLSLRQLHVAAFLGLGSDYDSEETERLCRKLHDAPRGRPLALIAITDKHRHADRIRMQLAGADQVLFRPVNRGAIARALDDCGLRLPEDPRRHGGGTSPLPP